MLLETVAKNRVRELRARLGLRQSDLAREIGVTRQSVIAIERCRLNPSILLALRIARVLREPVDYVFYLAQPTEGLPVDEGVGRSGPRVTGELAEASGVFTAVGVAAAAPHAELPVAQPSNEDKDSIANAGIIWDFPEA